MWKFKKDEFEVVKDETRKSSSQSDQSEFQHTKSSDYESSSDPPEAEPDHEPSSESDLPTNESSLEPSSEFESDPTGAIETDTVPQFSVNESLLPDQLICENDLIAEQEIDVLPQPIIIDGLIAEIETVEVNLQITGVNDSILAEQEFTTQDMLDSLGDKEPIVLDFRTSDEQERSDSTEVPSSGHGQVQQLLLEQVQEPEEQEQLTDDQKISDTSQIEQDEVELDQQPLTEDELTEQERLGQEFCDNKTNTSESLNDQVIADKSYTHEKFDQLVRDYQTSLEQRAALEEDSSSNEQQEADLDQQTATTCDNVINETDDHIDSDLTQQEGLSENTLTFEQKEPQNLTARDIVPNVGNEVDQQTDREELSNELERPIQEQQLDYSQDAIVEAKSNSIIIQVEQPLVIESETPHTVEDLLPQTDFPSYFSTQETISTQLFSELCLMEDTLESVSDDLLQSTNLSENSLSEIVSESPSLDLDPKSTPNLFQDLKLEILSIEEYLSSIDSPRLLELFHTQMQEETTRLLLIDDSQSLPNLESSLELVSEGPTIPDPPPYDFLQDLEEQEEANQRSSSTRSYLLWSLKQARLRQEVANYQFALRNLPIVKNQIQRDVQKADLPKSLSSELIVKANQQATNSHKSNGQREEASNTLDTFLIPQTQTQSQTNEISSERGIWGHLSIHIPLLGRVGTDKFLDSLIQSKQQEHDILIAITEKSWSLVKEHMENCAYRKDVGLDPRIMEIIVHWCETHLSIKKDSLHEDTKWVITTSSTQQDYVEKSRTEIVFKFTGWHEERLKGIKTISMNQIQPQINFDVWLFRRYDPWIQRINNTDILEKKYDRLLLQNPLITEYDETEDPLFKMGNDIFDHGKELHNRQFVNLKLNNEETKSLDIKYKDLIPYKSVEIRVHLKSHWDSKEITGSFKTHVRVDLIDKLRLNPSEKDIEEFIGQERVLEGIITLNSEYKDGDSIFMRNQVRTDNLRKIPQNTKVNLKQFGNPDPKDYRQPDYVVLGLKNRENAIKIPIALGDIKKSLKEFRTNQKGYGIGQLFRDARWHIYILKENMKEYFPHVKEEDIQVSFYILTAKVDDKNVIIIEGEELIRDVPAPYVYPYTGIIYKNDKDVFKVIERIREAILRDLDKD